MNSAETIDAPRLFAKAAPARLKWFSQDLGYGFVVLDGGREAFLLYDVAQPLGDLLFKSDVSLIVDVMERKKGLVVTAASVEKPFVPTFHRARIGMPDQEERGFCFVDVDGYERGIFLHIRVASYFGYPEFRLLPEEFEVAIGKGSRGLYVEAIEPRGATHDAAE